MLQHQRPLVRPSSLIAGLGLLLGGALAPEPASALVSRCNLATLTLLSRDQGGVRLARRRARRLDPESGPVLVRGSRLRLIATILDPRTIRAILLSLGLPADVADRAPPAHSARAAAEAVPRVPA